MRAIITYHSIDDSGSPISVTRDAFRRHMHWLARAPVRVTTVPALLDEPSTDDAIAITFDDAFANFETEAAPVLRSYALPATVFVVSDRVGTDNSWGGRTAPGIPTLPLLTWTGLERVANDGIALGAHSRTHVDLTQVASAALAEETAGAANEIARRIGVRPDTFAYPYGAFDDRAAAVVSAHFRCGCTTELRPVEGHDASALLPRLDMYYFQAAGRLEAWGTSAFDRFLTLRRWGRRLRGMTSGVSVR